nr:FlgD immunoglobulin-like domain containing protein [Nocardioides thalensis]
MDTVPIRWDSQNLSIPTTGACCAFVEGVDEFFPATDGYLDTFEFRSSRSTESVAMDVVIRDVRGAVVFDGEATRLPDGLRIAWDGRDDAGATVPEGEYVAEVSITDAVGNVSTHERVVRVSDRAIVQKTLRIPVGVDESRFARDRVGCGRLVRPARAEWPESVGYYTPEACRADALYSIGTRHRVKLPDSFTGTYGNSRITVVGGKSRLEKRSQLLLEHYAEGDPDQVTYVRGIDGNTGPHVGHWTPIRPRTFEGRDGRYLTWGIRARQGSRYDVRRFVIEVEYDVLE